MFTFLKIVNINKLFNKKHLEKVMSVIYGPKSMHCYLYSTGPW